MKKTIPKKLLNSKYRKEMWAGAQDILKILEKVLPVTSVHVLGSFTTKKTRPADVDFIVFIKTKEKGQRKWAMDLTIAPDNNYGRCMLKDADKWVKEKYGLKKSTKIRLK
jgi:hypothetical protein